MFPGHHFLRAVIYFLTQNRHSLDFWVLLLLLLVFGFFFFHYVTFSERFCWNTANSITKFRAVEWWWSWGHPAVVHDWPVQSIVAMLQQQLFPWQGFSHVHRNEDLIILLLYIFFYEMLSICYNNHKGKDNALKVTPKAWCFLYSFYAWFHSSSHLFSLASRNFTVNKAFLLFPIGKQAHCNTLYHIIDSALLMLHRDLLQPRCRIIPHPSSLFPDRNNSCTVVNRSLGFSTPAPLSCFLP